MTTKVPTATAEFLEKTRDLVIAFCSKRPDGSEVLKHLTGGRLRLVIDELNGLVTFGTVAADGSVGWHETISCDPTNEATFGRLASQQLTSSGLTH